MDEANSSNDSSVQKLQIAYTVASSIGVLISCLLLIGVLFAKAFKTFLQRLFIVIVVVTLLHDVIRVASVHHNPEDDIHDKSCIFLALSLQWLHWCLYLSLTAGVVYLLVIVCVQSGGNSVVLNTVRSSKLLRILLEVGVITGTLLAPWAIIWVPYVLNQYGFDNIICAIIPSNSTNETAIDIFVIVFYGYAPREILVLFSGVSALGMTFVYCKLSNEMKHARNVIKKLVILMLVLFIYFLLLNLQLIGRNSDFNLSLRMFFVFWHFVVKFSLLFGYLVLFHCSNINDQIKKLSKRKKADEHQIDDKEKEKEYGTFKESSRKSAPSSTYFSIPFTGGFPTTSKV